VRRCRVEDHASQDGLVQMPLVRAGAGTGPQ
jgi:hypothetical protein